MSNEKYVNTPLSKADYNALKTWAKENGRNPARELAQIAKRALKRRNLKQLQKGQHKGFETGRDNGRKEVAK